MKYIKTYLLHCISLALVLTSCKANDNCSFKIGRKFDGNGILIMPENAAQDGWTFAIFFPVCQVDTTDLLGTLKRAGEGVLIQADHQEILAALHKRSLILIRNNSQKPMFLRQMYLTSVHMSLADTVDTDANSKIIFYKLDTDKIKYEQKVTTLNNSVLRAMTISGI